MKETDRPIDRGKGLQIPALIVEEADCELDDLDLQHGHNDAIGQPTQNLKNGVSNDESNDESNDGSNNEDEKVITLRRKNGGQETLRVADLEGYKYASLVQTQTQTSRKKMEIGNESMISDADLRLAATLVHDAMEGRTVDIKTEPKYVRSYNYFKSKPLTYVLYLAIIVDLGLVVFEKPAIKGLELPCYTTMTIELICIIYFLVRTCHHAHWRGFKPFIRDTKNAFVIFITVVTVVDMLAYLIVHYGYPTDSLNVRYSRALRPLLIVNSSDGRQIRRAWRNIRRTISKILHVVALFFFFILVFSLIGYQIFVFKTDIVYPGGKPYFKTYWDSFWDLFVLVTTSNSPDVILPAYDNSPLYCIFFSMYTIVCFYMLLNVFLAVAYHSYNENMKEEILRSVRGKRNKLGQAFEVIKVNYNGEDMVTYKIWKRLMKLTKPGLSKNQVDLLMMILDMKKCGHIGRKEFMNVADLLNVPVSEVEDRTTWLEAIHPGFYNSVPSEYLRMVVDSVFYKFFFDAIIVIHIFLLAFFVEGIDILFNAIFTIEILLKIYSYGPQRFFKKIANWFDVSITFFSLVRIIVSYSVQGSGTHEFVRILNTLRIFRVLRLLVHIKRFKIITDTLVNISLSIFMYGGIIFIVIYVYAIVGIEIFQNKVMYYENVTEVSQMFCGTKELNGSVFYESGYCSLNFNDFLGACMALFVVFFQNNWHILAEGYVAVTNPFARIYFASFFMFASIVIMNIVTAFVVDMFMYEYTIQKEGKLDSEVESKIKELGLGIDADTGLEISEPLSDNQLDEMIQSGQIEAPPQHPWIERSTMSVFKNAENRFARLSTYVINRRSTIAPTLTRFDGIRFHIKKKGAVFVLAVGMVPINWSKPGRSELFMISMSALKAMSYFVMSKTGNIWVAYALFDIVYIVIHISLTVQCVEIAKTLPGQGYGFVYGCNMFGGLLIETVFTAVVVDSAGIGVGVRQQFFLYGLYYSLNASVFVAVGITTAIKRAQGSTKAMGTDKQRSPTSSDLAAERHICDDI